MQISQNTTPTAQVAINRAWSMVPPRQPYFHYCTAHRASAFAASVEQPCPACHGGADCANDLVGREVAVPSSPSRRLPEVK